MKVVWLCPYPINILPEEKIQFNKNKDYHPASWILNLSNALAEDKSIDLHIISETKWINRDYNFTHNGITFHIHKNPYKIPFIGKSIPSKIPLMLYTDYYFIKRKILKTIEMIDPDLVHFHGTEGVNSRIALSIKIPYIISIQGLLNLYNNYVNVYHHKNLSDERNVIRNSVNFASRTKWADDYIKELNPNAKIFYSPEAMNPVYFKESNKKRENIILFVGTLERRKGIHYLIDSFKNVIILYPEYKLFLVGYGNKKYMEEILRKISVLGLKNNIEFLGRKNPEEIKKLHDISQIFVFPTLIDNSPNSVAEAMVSGLPVITTNVGGIPSMIKNYQTGILIPSKNTEVLTEKIIELIENTDLRSEIGVKARKTAYENHLPKKVATKTVEIYKNIL